MKKTSILNVAQNRMRLLWALAFAIMIIVPMWILVQQTIFTPKPAAATTTDFQQRVKNRTRITNFGEAKRAMYQQLYFDHRTTFYCECDFTASRLIDLTSCGMPILGQRIKTEAEHVVPASHFGKRMTCWQQGGRKNCSATDVAFQKAEGDLINLVPAVGYINMRRSNYKFGEVSGEERQFGSCDFEIDSLWRIAEPQEKLLGFIARITLYMESVYGMGLTRSEIEHLKQQSLAHPPTEWEILRDQRIAQIQGNHNPFVSNF